MSPRKQEEPRCASSTTRSSITTIIQAGDNNNIIRSQTFVLVAPKDDPRGTRGSHQSRQQSHEGYAETRILAKQGKLKSKGRGVSEREKSATAIQLSLLISLGLAFIISPVLGRKIAQDDEFREKYVPDWYDFRVKPPKSAWTREELHHQIIEVEKDMRERAIRGDFTPEKLEELQRSLQPRSDLSDEDIDLAKRHGWGTIHPGVDPDDYDDDDE